MNSYLKVLYPGMHIKRWLLLILVGITLISLGLAYLMAQVYRTQPFPEWVATLTLQFIDRPLRGLMFIGAGVVAASVAIYQLNRSLLAPFLNPGHDNVLKIIHHHRARQRGPRIVALGGGTGLSTLLRGLKEYSDHVTAIVTVTDDGGSSGRLRRQLGILPPGDFRQCLVALADVEPLMTRLFQYRFTEGDDLEGHSFGNLFIAAMIAITGSFERALRESSRVLAVRGQILPSTLANLTLCAEFEDDATVIGESAIPQKQKHIRHVYILPAHPPAYPEALRAIQDADLVVIGPGSVFTSVLPNLLVHDITRAIRANTHAVKVYVCNVATERGETDGYVVADHIKAFEQHVGLGLFGYVLVNSNYAMPQEHAAPVLVHGRQGLAAAAYTLLLADLIDLDEPRRHDPQKLARSLIKLYFDRDRLVRKAAPSEARTVQQPIA